MPKIKQSVGRGGRNQRTDVLVIQNLLNRYSAGMALPPGPTSGLVDRALIDRILRFQKDVVGLSNPDGRVDPGGRTLKMLQTAGSADLGRYQYPAGAQERMADLAIPYIGATEATGNRMGTDPRMREIFEADRLVRDGQTDGYPWCAAFVSLVTQKFLAQSAFHGHVRPPRTAGVTAYMTRWAVQESCLVFPPDHPVYVPHRGDVVVFTFSHIGIVTRHANREVNTIEGNTNEAGSREGTTVRRKRRPYSLIRAFIRMPIPASYDMDRAICTAPSYAV